MASEFKREERYIVIKRKYLRGANEAELRIWLAREGVPVVECAVVESDWPEYETVWKMIESRVGGCHGQAKPALFGILAGESEVIGERCADGGKCHHECKRECWRRTRCVPLGGSRLNDDWSIPAPDIEPWNKQNSRAKPTTIGEADVKVRRRELLDYAMSFGATLTGTPDGSEAITVVFDITSWRLFCDSLTQPVGSCSDPLIGNEHVCQSTRLTLDDIDAAFNAEISRVSALEYNANAICRKFYQELRSRLTCRDGGTHD